MLRFADEHSVVAQRPLRILHVVGEMNRGGIETWLMHMLRAIDRNQFTMDFAVESEQQAEYDEEVLDLGAQLNRIGSRLSPGYAARFCRLIRQSGPYDIVHGHLNHYNGYIMRLARWSGVPARISHSHTDTTARERAAGWKRRLGIRLLRKWITRYSSQGLAASVPAAISMFGTQWAERNLCRIMHCGVDLSPFGQTYDRVRTRAELGIPDNAWVIGHVGRMVEVKNHRLIIDTFANLRSQAENAYLLLVGDGPLMGDLTQQARELNVSDRVVFAGSRSDVPRILCAAVDTFVFPSKLEGLGIALIEAQAAGLPCLVSDVVPDEADVIPDLITRLSVHQSWAPALLRTRDFDRRQKQCLDRLLQTDFSIQEGIAALQRTYEQAVFGTSRAGREACIEAIK